MATSTGNFQTDLNGDCCFVDYLIGIWTFLGLIGFIATVSASLLIGCGSKSTAKKSKRKRSSGPSAITEATTTTSKQSATKPPSAQPAEPSAPEPQASPSNSPGTKSVKKLEKEKAYSPAKPEQESEKVNIKKSTKEGKPKVKSAKGKSDRSNLSARSGKQEDSDSKQEGDQEVPRTILKTELQLARKYEDEDAGYENCPDMTPEQLAEIAKAAPPV